MKDLEAREGVLISFPVAVSGSRGSFYLGKEIMVSGSGGWLLTLHLHSGNRK